jgi:hypothetical protein
VPLRDSLLAANNSAQAKLSIPPHKRILTYRIATLQTHCKSLALKNQAGGVVGKCRQLKIRFARHFGQARGLARRKEKSPSGL